MHTAMSANNSLVISSPSLLLLILFLQRVCIIAVYSLRHCCRTWQAWEKLVTQGQSFSGHDLDQSGAWHRA